MTDSDKILEGQLRECYGRVVYTQKTHEKCADNLLARHKRIKLAQIVLAALVTSGLLAAIVKDYPAIDIISVLLSTILLGLNTYTKDHDLGELAQKHRRTAADIWKIREEYLSLLTDLRAGGFAMNALRVRRDTLAQELHSVYLGAPSTNPNAYKATQKALKVSEDMTFSEAEVDAFLPNELKRSSP